MGTRQKRPRRARQTRNTGGSAKKATGILIGRARQTWTWYSAERKAALKAASTRMGWRRCVSCGFEVPESETQADHRIPVVEPGEPSPSIEIGKAVGWDRYLTRLWTPLSNIDVLCKECHSKKSKKENAERKRRRDAAAKKA